MATVFIVDDDNSIRFLYQRLLSLKGHDVIGMASNGAEAVELFKSFSKKPDIILIDHRMPIKNGLEATKELLQIDPNARIIFASADTSIKNEALSNGAASFQQKPFIINALIKDIEKAAV